MRNELEKDKVLISQCNFIQWSFTRYLKKQVIAKVISTFVVVSIISKHVSSGKFYICYIFERYIEFIWPEIKWRRISCYVIGKVFFCDFLETKFCTFLFSLIRNLNERNSQIFIIIILHQHSSSQWIYSLKLVGWIWVIWVRHLALVWIGNHYWSLIVFNHQAVI